MATDLPRGREPVLVGVGEASADAEAVTLMVAAVEAAVADAGTPALAAAVDRVAVPQGSWSYPDPARIVAERIGAPAARTLLVELGIPQQRLIDDALLAIQEGRSEVAVVVGGEAKRWARARERAGLDAVETAQEGVVPDEVHRREGPLLEPVEVAHRLWDPVQQYAMIENALRAADGCAIADHRREVAQLWSAMNRVARSNPAAAFPAPLEAAEIDTPSADNRLLAFPYNKWHSTQWTVDQAAALVLCSADTARRLGVPVDRWVFPRCGLTSGHAVSLVCRERPTAWPAMEVLAAAAAGRLGRPVADAEVIELYSCFPAAVRVQQRALGLDRTRVPTVTGGMAFAGGPFNNYVYQALVTVVGRLRADPDALAVVTSVSGLLTKPGLGAFSGRPDGRPPLVADLARQAAGATGTVPAVAELDGYEGPGRVVTYTVTPEDGEPARVVALCATADGRRCVALSDDRALAAAACTEELVGAAVRIGAGVLTLR